MVALTQVVEVSPPVALSNFGAIRPHFPVKPAILQREFDHLQVYTRLDEQIFTVERWVTIHTVPSTAFFGELG